MAEREVLTLTMPIARKMNGWGLSASKARKMNGQDQSTLKLGGQLYRKKALPSLFL